MKKLKVSLLFILSMSILFSCRNDDDNGTHPNTPSSNADYLPANSANRWVYDIYRVDSSGAETFIMTDTMTVKDTLFNGLNYQFYKYRLLPSQTYRSGSLMRDSSGYMINPSGKVVFAVNPLNTVLRTDSIGSVYVSTYEMKRETGGVNVPVGTFHDVLNYRNTFAYNSGITPPAGMPAIRHYHNRYARNIGLVSSTYAYATTPDLHYFERRLTSFHIAP